MPNPSEKFQSLIRQLDALVSGLQKPKSMEERGRLLRRMKVVIDEIDELNLKPVA
jgi:hypothetical protein